MAYTVHLQTQSGWSLVQTIADPINSGGQDWTTPALQSYLASLPASWNGYTLRISRNGWYPATQTVAWWKGRTLGQLRTMFLVGPPPALAPPPLPPRRYVPGTWSVGLARAGATPSSPVPDPAVEWTWQAQQAYTTGLDVRLRELEGEVSQNQTATAVIGGVSGLIAAALVLLGVQLSRRGF